MRSNRRTSKERGEGRERKLDRTKERREKKTWKGTHGDRSS